jgi:hypothetical protein
MSPRAPRLPKGPPDRIPDSSGKKTERLHLPRQLCITPAMHCEIKALAEREDRTLQGQIRHLLKLGIAVEEQLDAKEKKSGKA